MKDFNKSFLRPVFLIIWDFVTATAAVFLSVFMFYGIGENFPVDNIFRYVFLYFAVLVILHILTSLYSGRSKNFGTLDIFKHAVVSLVTGVICALLPMALKISKFIMGWKASFITVLLIFIFSCAGFGAVRLYLSVFRYYFNRAGNEKNINTIIYGAGELGSYLAKRMFIDDSKNRPVGFVDDNPALKGNTVSDLKILGTSENLSKIIADTEAKEIVIAINDLPKKKLREIIAVCAESSCQIRRFGKVDDVTSPTGRRLDMSDIDTNDLIRRERVELDMESVSKFITDKVVMVTGGAGSIGSEICNQVLKYGAKKLIIFDIHENGLFFIDNKLRPVYGRERYETILGSVRDTQRLDLVFEKYHPQVVFHAAAHKHVPMMEYNPCEAIKNNVFGTLNTAQAAVRHDVEKFILISTDKAVNPTNIMGASKRIAELVIQTVDRNSKTQFAAVRFGNVLGSVGSVVPLFLEQIKNGGPVKVTHPEMKRYFMTIPEAVQLVLEAGALAKGGEIFVLDMGEPVLITDLAADLIRLSGQIPNKDIDIVYTGLRPGEKLFEELSLSSENATKTQNDKIYVCKPVPIDTEFIKGQAEALKSNAANDDKESVFDIVRKLVPTFKHD